MKDEEFRRNLNAILEKLEKIEWKARKRLKAEAHVGTTSYTNNPQEITYEDRTRYEEQT